MTGSGSENKNHSKGFDLMDLRSEIEVETKPSPVSPEFDHKFD